MAGANADKDNGKKDLLKQQAREMAASQGKEWKTLSKEERRKFKDAVRTQARAKPSA